MRSRLAGIAVGILAGLAVTTGLARLRPAERPAALRVVPDSGGHLRAVLLQYDPGAAEAVVPVYRDLLAAFDDDLEIRVAVARDEDFADLRERLAAAGARGLDRLRPLVVGRPITTWSRDRYLAARRGGRPVLIAPGQAYASLASRANDWLVPWVAGLRLAPRVDVVGAPFAFDGGDFAVDEERAYATALLVERNRGTRLGDPAALLAELRRYAGVETLLVGSSPDEVPAHHIGMFVTPIGNGVVLVGDPDLARQALGGGCDEACLGDLDADLSEPTVRRFRFVAASLEAAGLRVIRVPLLPTAATYVYFTYNNVVIDDRADGRHVMLPQYGVEALDAAGRAAWERLGFVVHPIDASRLYRNGGAVRCLVAVLDRSTP
jgi:hypothetical protein